MQIIHLASILMEFIVMILGIKIAIDNKKSYGYFIALTFGIYVFYDLAKFLNFNVSLQILYLLFLIASSSILIGVWQMYKRTSK